MEKFLDSNIDPKSLSSLTLAFLGDSVYEMFVREALVSDSNRHSGELHAEKVNYVSAKAQANAMDKIMDMLTEEELAVYKRGRNAHTTHTPKNMTSAEYHMATGFESLFGYLYLNGELERLRELFNKIWQ